MKRVPLIASLLLNATLLALLVARPALDPAPVRDFIIAHFGAQRAPVAPVLAVKVKAAPPSLWSQLQTDDLSTLVARLRQAGFPPGVIRRLVATSLEARYEARYRELTEGDPNTPFWKKKGSSFALLDKRFEQLQQLWRERSSLERELLKDPFFATDEISASERRKYGNLSKAKIDALQRVETDYNEMMTGLRAAMNGVELPEDREKLGLLAREKGNDLAALLTPEELAEYQMRTSAATNYIRSQLSSFDASEAEFRAIYQAMQALSDRYPTPPSLDAITNQEREQLVESFGNQLRSSLGDARYADYLRESNFQFQQVAQIADSQNVPHDTLVKAYDLRESASKESNRIFDDPNLSNDEKRVALQQLAQSKRSEITTLLGETTGQAYAKFSDAWLRALENGRAITFTSSPTVVVTSNNGWSSSFSGGSNLFKSRSLPRR